MTRKPRTRNQVEKNKKFTPKITKTQGQFEIERTNFIDEIIWKSKSQASVSHREVSGKGYTIISPRVAGSSATTNAEIHDKTVGSEQSLEDVPVRHLIPFDNSEGNFCNLREGRGEKSEPYPQPYE